MEKPLRYYLSQSALQSYERCPRKYYYQYIMIYYGESVYSVPLDFGLSIHDILEKSTEIPVVDREQVVQKLIYEKVLEIEGDTKKDYEDRLIKLVKPLAKISIKYDIVEAELYVSDKLFSLDALNNQTKTMIYNILKRKGKDLVEPIEGIWFGGYIDAVVRNGNQEDVIDWKTGRFSRKWIAKYERQIQLYTHLMRLNGRPVKTAKIVYVEQKGKEHLVDISVDKCKKVYLDMIQAFTRIIALGEDKINFPMIDNQAECNGCYFDFICN